MSGCLIAGLTSQEMAGGIVCPRPGIPKKSHVRVESLPKRLVLFDGIASKSLTVDLDPGKYAVSISKFTPEKIMDSSYTYEFFHEITEKAWKALSSAKPKFVKIMNTSEGPRWRCTLGQCDFEATSEVSAVVHEYEHKGVNLFDAIAKGATPQAVAETVKPQVITESDVAVMEGSQAEARKTALEL